MSYNNIIFQIQDGIATITFNRPKSLNALNTETFDELLHAVGEIDTNEDIRVLILTGAGEKAFIAGADIVELNQLSPLQLKCFSKKGQDTMCRLQEIAIPVIAAVNGFALGGGCEMAMACDFIYASETAAFGLPEINLGLIPGFGGTQRLPRRIGMGLAKELLFTGKMISASEALQIGLVNKVCAPHLLMEEVLKTAKVIATKGKVSLRAAKQTVNAGMNTDLETGLILECDAFTLCKTSEDATEGIGAFLEKRKAVFKGRLRG